MRDLPAAWHQDRTDVRRAEVRPEADGAATEGGVVIYGDAEFPEAARPTPATDATENTITGSQAANPFTKALLAAVDPNARKEARKSLDRRQAVDATSTASSGTPGGKTAGGLTKEKSFGRANSSGRT